MHRASKTSRGRTWATIHTLVRLGLSTTLGIVFLAGCASVRFGSVFTEAGTATHTLEVTFPRASMNDQDLARVERQIADAEVKARSGGLTTVRIDNPDTIGLRVINTTTDSIDVGLALNSIFNTLVVDPTTGPVAPFQGTFEQASGAVGGNSFKLDLTVNGDVLYSAASKVAPGHPQFSSPEGVREIVQIEYQATMPGEITETNGGKQGDGSVIWTIPLDGPTELHARSTVGNETPWLWTIIAIGAALSLVAVTAAIVWTILLSRRREGRSRIPVAVQIDSINGHPTAPVPVKPPDTFPEIRESLVGLVRRMFNGEPISPHTVIMTAEQTTTKDDVRGADPEGD